MRKDATMSLKWCLLSWILVTEIHQHNTTMNSCQMKLRYLANRCLSCRLMYNKLQHRKGFGPHNKYWTTYNQWVNVSYLKKVGVAMAAVCPDGKLCFSSAIMLALWVHSTLATWSGIDLLTPIWVYLCWHSSMIPFWLPKHTSKKSGRSAPADFLPSATTRKLVLRAINPRV